MSVTRRTAAAFPTLNTPGDPRTLSEINNRTPKLSVGELFHTPGGTILIPAPSRRQSKPPAVVCAFGSIIKKDAKTYIKGGNIYCGDQNWLIEDKEIFLTTPLVALIFFDVEIVANQDDDEEVLLPGIKTGTKPDWDQVPYHDGEDYPENESPTPGTGAGNIILPVGKLTIVDKKATLENTGCGGFSINQCAGSLSFVRI